MNNGVAPVTRVTFTVAPCSTKQRTAAIVGVGVSGVGAGNHAVPSCPFLAARKRGVALSRFLVVFAENPYRINNCNTLSLPYIISSIMLMLAGKLPSLRPPGLVELFRLQAIQQKGDYEDPHILYSIQARVQPPDSDHDSPP